jgi:hypothetical protein
VELTQRLFEFLVRHSDEVFHSGVVTPDGPTLVRHMRAVSFCAVLARHAASDAAAASVQTYISSAIESNYGWKPEDVVGCVS